MPAKDFYHNAVKAALQKDGWRITADPLWPYLLKPTTVFFRKPLSKKSCTITRCTY